MKRFRDGLKVHSIEELEKPMVSIIIPTYNYGRYLHDSIRSALGQTYSNIEVIIIDDGSTDNTNDIVKPYPVRYFFQNNQGVSTAMNNGINLSNGKYFICLGADDKLAPEYVRKTMNQMMTKSNVGIVCTGSRVWNEETKIENLWIPHKISNKYAIFAGWVGVLGTVLTRREAFDSLHYGFDPSLPVYEDLDMCFRLFLKGWKIKVVSEPLHWYRLHQNSRNTAAIKTKQFVESLMNKKYGYILFYKKIYDFYKMTLRRLVNFIIHPIEYVKGIREKIKVMSWIRSFYWTKQINREKAQELVRAIFLTVDNQIEWSWNKRLNDYYEKRLILLEYKMKHIFYKDASVRKTSKI